MTKTWLWSILSLIGWESLSRVQSQITFDTCLSMRASIDGSLYFVIFEWLSISLFYRRVTNFRVWDCDNCHNLSLTKTKLRRGRSRLHSSCCKKCFLIEYKDCMKQVQISYDTWTFGYLLCKKKKKTTQSVGWKCYASLSASLFPPCKKWQITYYMFCCV